MADEYQYINTTGVIVPDTSDLLTTVQDEYKAVFGTDLIVDPSTPQGVLITAEVLARDAFIRNNAAVANQLNPNIAGGVFLDAIAALTALKRDAATKSFVLADLTGVAGTIIPSGVRAKTAAGDIFESTGTVILDSSGEAQVAFQSVEYGPVPALSGGLSQIVDGVLGWENITNASSATLGQLQQSDQSFRALRKVTLALQGVALVEAQISALYAVDGVTSLTYRENVTGSTITIEGVSLVEHSVYACVNGGTDQDVAMALLENKSAGANWNGGVTVNVVEPVSGQTYAVKFSRPTAVPIKVRATVKTSDALIDPAAAVKQAILDYAAGLLDGEPGFVVGADISPFELAGAVNRETPEIYVQNMEITTVAANTFSNSQIVILISQIATLAESDITVDIV